MCWFKIIQLTNCGTLFDISNGAGNQNVFIQLNYNSLDLLGRIYTATNSKINIWTSNPMVLNNWYHAALTYDAGILSIYRDGVQAMNISGLSFSPRIRYSNYFGLSTWNEYLIGCLDEIKIFNRALTSAEILAEMNNVYYNKNHYKKILLNN